MKQRGIKRIIGWIGVGVAMAGILYCLRPAYRGVKAWRSAEHLRVAEAFMRAGQWERAVARGQAALQLQPGNEAGLRFMAQLLALLRNESAFEFWGILESRSLATTADQLAAAELALSLGHYAMAERNLEPLLRANDSGVAAPRLAASYCLLRGEIEAGIQYARQAWERDSADLAVKLVLGRLLSASSQGGEQREGQQLLLELTEGSGPEAFAAIIALAGLRDCSAETLRLLERSLERFAARGWDRDFAAADLQLRLRPDASTGVFDKLDDKAKAVTDPNELARIGRWFNSHRQFERALNLRRDIPIEKLGSQFLLAWFDALAGLRRWPELREALAKRGLALEPMRISIYRARTALALEEPRIASLHWEQALSFAGRDPSRLWFLAEYAERAGARRESAAAYRRIIGEGRGVRAAFGALLRLSRQEGDTRKTRELLREMCGKFRGEPELQNDLGYLNLLVGEEIEASRNAAEALLRQRPELLAARTTLALAHYRSGRFEAAERAYEGLRIEWGKVLPGWRAVRAAVLAVNGSRIEAARVLEGMKLELLLPEEQALAGSLTGRVN